MTAKFPDAALFYAQRLQWAVFPVQPGTKRPATEHGFKDATAEPDKVRAFWKSNPKANIATATGAVTVLDFDSYKPEYAGAELLEMLLEDFPTPCTDTARGGVQLFYAARPGITLTNAAGKLPACVDVRGRGGYVLLPPSTFIEDGKAGTYKWRAGCEPWNMQLAPIPTLVLDLILAQPETRQRPNGDNLDNVIEEFNRSHRIADILTAHGYKLGRQNRTYSRLARPGKEAIETSVVVGIVGGVERSYHHSTTDALHTNGHARDAFDVWTHLEHGGDAKSAYTAAKKAQGKWTDGKPAATNGAAVFRNEDGPHQNGTGPAVGRSPIDGELLSERIAADLQRWRYSFSVNDLEDAVLVNGEPMTDFHTAALRARARDAGYGSKGNPSLGALEDMVRVLANRNRFHPVRDWLNGLQWDGRNHFGLLCMHFKADGHKPIEYANGHRLAMFDAWLRRWALGAVGKAFGNVRACQQNAMLVLDGAQGRGKSYFARWLCSPLSELFEEGAIVPGDKEHTRKQTTKFIWEVSELGSTVRAADREALKAFITHATLTYRRPYDRNNVVKPALSSFVGTMNNESGFLTDPTGNRRFLVVTLTGIDWGYSSKVDPAQFWAQVMQWYRDGQTWELTPEETARQADTNADYEAVDIFQDALLRHFEFTGKPEDFMGSDELVQHLQNCGIRDSPRAASMAISAALRRLGHKPERGYTQDGARVRGYKGIKPKPLSTVVNGTTWTT